MAKTQITLFNERGLKVQDADAKPWKGVCCARCWNARTSRCVCKCGGLFHGAGNRRFVDKQIRTLTEKQAAPFKMRITLWRCPNCNHSLIGEPIKFVVGHSGGYQVPGIPGVLWLLIECPGCRAQLALWKLGVKRMVNKW